MKIRNFQVNRKKLLILTLFLTVILVFDYKSVTDSGNSVVSDQDSDSDELKDINDDVDVDFARVRKVDRTSPELRYVEAVEDILAGEFTPVAEVSSENEDTVNIAMIMINLNTTTDGLSGKFKLMVRYIYSLVCTCPRKRIQLNWTFGAGTMAMQRW